MNREPILFDVDLIKEYAEKRKGLEEEDVKDLLRCLIGYLRHRMDSGETYAIYCKYLGVFHKTYDNSIDYKEFKSTKFGKLQERMMINFALLGDLSPSNKTPKFNNNERRELQAHTNNREN